MDMQSYYISNNLLNKLFSGLVVIFGVFTYAFIQDSMVHKPFNSLSESDAISFSSESDEHEILDFETWKLEGKDAWDIRPAPSHFVQKEKEIPIILGSQFHGEEKTGKATSPVFTIATSLQSFYLAGADGTETGLNDGDNNYFAMRSHPDGKILKYASPPGTHVLAPYQWNTFDLIGQEVYLELVDDNPQIRDDGYAWIALGNYQQVHPDFLHPVTVDNFYGITSSPNVENEVVESRSLPFFTSVDPSPPSLQGDASVIQKIQIGVKADMLYLLGMVNHGWDGGVAHWGEHAELQEERDDQIYIGKEIGRVEVHYSDGEFDEIPLVMGSTAFFIAPWAHGPGHAPTSVREPFESRPDFNKLFNNTFRLKEDTTERRWDIHYYLPVRPRDKLVEEILVFNNDKVRGNPYISSVTVRADTAPGHARKLSRIVEATDLEPTVILSESFEIHGEAKEMADALYMCDEDIPESVELLPFPNGLDATRIRFQGGVEADMLTNVWTTNLALIDEKFPADKGVFYESVKDVGPWYGGYGGIGTWAPVGVYWGEETAYGRSSDHYATLALRHINNRERLSNYVDYVDYWLYFFRDNHDPDKGPDNSELDIERYPEGAFPNWSFIISYPMILPYGEIDPVPGTQETDGHGATMVGRWMAWRMMGAPTDEWLEEPRNHVWGHSRWQSTYDAAEFVCWYMDFTGQDVMFSEGETTGWAGGPEGSPHYQIPVGMSEATGREEILWYYANSDKMYHVYPTWVCAVGLRGSAEIAEARGSNDLAARWRSYADRLRDGMYNELRDYHKGGYVWDFSPVSIFPTRQESLVHAWFSIYYDGLDSKQWDSLLTPVTRNTLQRQLNQPYGHAPALSMGYGQGWLTKSALMLDAMDDAGPLVWNIARYSYDKNMDFVDEEKGIDWRRWKYIIPEGTNILPDGRWYRIGDLSNGANQGPAMHALEVCAGVDDTNPDTLKIIPRVPDPLTGIEVENHPVLIPEERGLTTKRIKYSYDRTEGEFVLEADTILPNLSVRLGPFNIHVADEVYNNISLPEGATKRVEASGTWKNKTAGWLWIENLQDVDSVSFSYSVDIKDVNIDDQIQLYPNPVKENLVIEHDNLPLEEIVVLDLKGQVVIEDTGVHSSDGLRKIINVSKLKAGGYILVTRIGRQKIVKKFMKL